MSWWNSIPNSSCIFAIDANSKLIGDLLYFNNDSNRYVKLQAGTVKTDETISGQKPNTNSPMGLHVYKSLSISKGNLLFDEPIYIGNNFTIILKCKVNQSTIFLSNNGTNLGPTYGIGIQNNSAYTETSDHAWRFEGFITESEIPYSQRQFKLKTDIKTLIITGDLALKDVSVYTETGIYKVPKDSNAYVSTGFLQPRSYTNIGYHNSSDYWKLNTDIIAYGIFNRQINLEEIDTINTAIDTELKIKVIPSDFFDKSKSYVGIPLGSLEYILNSSRSYENTFQASKPLKTFIKNVSHDLNNVEYNNILYKNVKNIMDIVLEENVPVKTKLYLYEKYTGQLLKTTDSNSLGSFSFLDLDTKLDYIVRASDPKYHFQSILKDYNKGT